MDRRPRKMGQVWELESDRMVGGRYMRQGEYKILDRVWNGTNFIIEHLEDDRQSYLPRRYLSNTHGFYFRREIPMPVQPWTVFCDICSSGYVVEAHRRPRTYRCDSCSVIRRMR